MKGATAEVSVKIINRANSNKIMIMGASHHFLRTLRKDHSSLMIDNLLIYCVSPVV